MARVSETEKKSLAEKKKVKNMEKVLRDAQHYFEKNGFYNTTIGQLCEDAMISKSTFYNYFGSKEKIIELVIEQGIEEYRQYAEKEMDNPADPIASAKRVIDFQINSTLKYKNITSVFYQLSIPDDGLKALKREYDYVTAATLDKAMQLCGIDNPMSFEDLAKVIGGCFSNTILSAPIDLWQSEIARMIDVLIEMIKK